MEEKLIKRVFPWKEKRQTQHTTEQKTLHRHKNQNLQMGSNINCGHPRPFLLLPNQIRKKNKT